MKDLTVEELASGNWDSYCETRSADELIQTLELILQEDRFFIETTGQDSTAIDFLGAIGHDKAAEVLRIGIEHEEYEVRFAVTNNLLAPVMSVGGSENVGLFEKAMTDESIADLAVSALGSDGHKVTPQVALACLQLARRHGNL